MRKDITCPLDGRPCERDCPDRYADRPEGGCLLTTALEWDHTLVTLGEKDVAIVFPAEEQEVRT